MDKISYLVGYKQVIDIIKLKDLPCYCTSYILESGSRKTMEHGGRQEEYYPKSYAPGDSIFDQLVFSLKYEGVDLLILKKVFERIDPAELAGFIKSTPTGRHHRRLWYLYENLTAVRLELPDLTRGNYVDLVDSKKFFVAKNSQIRRQRINNNLLGDFSFSPSIRRTKKIEKYLEDDFSKKCKDIKGVDLPCPCPSVYSGNAKLLSYRAGVVVGKQAGAFHATATRSECPGFPE